MIFGLGSFSNFCPTPSLSSSYLVGLFELSTLLSNFRHIASLGFLDTTSGFSFATVCEAQLSLCVRLSCIYTNYIWLFETFSEHGLIIYSIDRRRFPCHHKAMNHLAPSLKLVGSFQLVDVIFATSTDISVRLLVNHFEQELSEIETELKRIAVGAYSTTETSDIEPGLLCIAFDSQIRSLILAFLILLFSVELVNDGLGSLYEWK